MKILTILFFISFNLHAAQKIIPVSNPKVTLVKNYLIVKGEVKLSLFKTTTKEDTVSSIGVIAPSLGCHQTYLCFAHNFSSKDGQLYGDVKIDLDMDGNIDRVDKDTFLGEMNSSEVNLSNFKVVYVNANRTSIEDEGKNFFFFLNVFIP